MNLIKIGIEGNRVKEYAVSDEYTVADVLLHPDIRGIWDKYYLTKNDFDLLGTDPSKVRVKNGDLFIARPIKTKTTIKIGRVGEKLKEWSKEASVQSCESIFSSKILADMGYTLAHNERLFLKKTNRPDFDLDITDNPHDTPLSDGDILVIEKDRSNLDKAMKMIYYLEDKGLIEIQDKEEIEEELEQYYFK